MWAGTRWRVGARSRVGRGAANTAGSLYTRAPAAAAAAAVPAAKVSDRVQKAGCFVALAPHLA